MTGRVLPLRHRTTRSWAAIVAFVAYGGFAVYSAATGEWIPIVFWLIYFGTMMPVAVRMVRSDPPRLEMVGDELRIEHGAFFREPVRIARDELHSIVPIWTRPGGGGVLVTREGPVVPSPSVVAVGSPGGAKGPALVLVLRAERQLEEGRQRWAAWTRPKYGLRVRGFVLAVDDLDAAQRFVQPLGLLARLTPGAFEWLEPKSNRMSPGSEPVYGT